MSILLPALPLSRIAVMRPDRFTACPLGTHTVIHSRHPNSRPDTYGDILQPRSYTFLVLAQYSGRAVIRYCSGHARRGYHCTVNRQWFVVPAAAVVGDGGEGVGSQAGRTCSSLMRSLFAKPGGYAHSELFAGMRAEGVVFSRNPLRSKYLYLAPGTVG